MFGVEVKASKKDDEGNILVEGVNEHLRQIGKVLNFAIAYGASAHKIADNFQISIKEAEEFIQKFYKAYPDLKIYFEKVQTLAKKRGFIVIDKFSKRRAYIKHFKEFKFLEDYITRHKESGWSSQVPKQVWSRYYTLKGSIERDSQNYPIQGQGANMTKLAACMFYEWAQANKIDADIVLIVHDELVVECNQKISKKVSKAVKFCMEKAGEIVLENNKVKIIANPIISNYWTH